MNVIVQVPELFVRLADWGILLTPFFCIGIDEFEIGSEEKTGC